MTFPEGSICCSKSESRTLRENTAHPYFRALANSAASFKTRRRCSGPVSLGPDQRAGQHSSFLPRVTTESEKRSFDNTCVCWTILDLRETSCHDSITHTKRAWLHIRHTNRKLRESPRLSDRRESLKIILLLDPALHPKLSQERHHLSDRDSRKLGSSTKRSLAFLILFHRE
jgi:hypothetical protein